MTQAVDRLASIIKRLRDPQKGCPWDIKQDFKSIASCTLEEAYEVVEAIEKDDMPSLKEELGDLLLQVVFHAQLATEKNLFSLDEIAECVSNKMIERHPHVFGDIEANTAEDVLKNWEANKAAKRARQAEEESRPHSLLDGINVALPAIARAIKIQKAVARVGFDWPDLKPVLDKVDEELAELKAEMPPSKEKDFTADKNRLEEELGDVLFALVNLARHLKIDPEKALRDCNRKFDRRFRAVEDRLKKEGTPIQDTNLQTMENAWQKIKEEEKG